LSGWIKQVLHPICIEAVVPVRSLNEIITHFVEYRMVARETDIFMNLGGMTEQARRGILSVKTQRESVSPTLVLPVANREKLSVRFSCIDIREYPICIGDNPGGRTGTPLSIEWEHVLEVQLGLEEYEESRPERRNHNALSMGETVRYDMLLRLGYSRLEIRTQTKPVNIERARRKHTAATLNLAPLQEFHQAISRKTLNALTFGARKRKERRMMESFASPELKGREPESDTMHELKGRKRESVKTDPLSELFDAAPQEARGVPIKKPPPDYFL
jgi:hypothetical protein